MRLRTLCCAFILSFAGCHAAPPAAPPPAAGPNEQELVVHAGHAVVSAAGTPFYLVFKGVACFASVAIAGPAAGLAAISDSPFAIEMREDLGDGVRRNCGPPYVLSPSQMVSLEPGSAHGLDSELKQAPSAGPEQPTPDAMTTGPEGPIPLFTSRAESEP